MEFAGNQFASQTPGRERYVFAAGVGRLDVGKRFFDHQGRLTPDTTREQLVRGCLRASMYGRREVVEFLLERGIAPAESHGNETMLHGAAVGGHPDIARMLIAHGVPIEVKDDNYHAARVGASHPGQSRRRQAGGAVYDVVRQLVAAGARVEDDWLAGQVSSDPELVAALTHHGRS